MLIVFVGTLAIVVGSIVKMLESEQRRGTDDDMQ
jgi:hypothetical protein